MIRIHSIIPESIVDGPGIRAAVFTQGCAHKCPGCHNPDTWDFNGGKEVHEEYILNEIRKNPLNKGVTFTGGDPVYQWRELLHLVTQLKDLGYHLILYTGFTMEELFSVVELHPDIVTMVQEEMGIYVIKEEDTDVQINDDTLFIRFLSKFDVIITDPFIEAEKSAELRHRGSRNQRVWKIHSFKRYISFCDRIMQGFRMENITVSWDEECQTCESKPDCEKKADPIRDFFPMRLCGLVSCDDHDDCD